jgi:hypothetical protein
VFEKGYASDNDDDALSYQTDLTRYHQSVRVADRHNEIAVAPALETLHLLESNQLCLSLQGLTIMYAATEFGLTMNYSRAYE